MSSKVRGIVKYAPEFQTAAVRYRETAKALSIDVAKMRPPAEGERWSAQQGHAAHISRMGNYRRLGEVASRESGVKAKQKLWEDLYQKRIGRLQREFFGEYRGLKRTSPKLMGAQLGVMLHRLQRYFDKVEREMVALYHAVHVEKYEDTELNLTATHIFFASQFSVLVIANLEKPYNYVRLLLSTNREVVLCDPHGVPDLDQPGVGSLVKQCTRFVASVRRLREERLSSPTHSIGAVRSIVEAGADGGRTASTALAEGAALGDDMPDDLVGSFAEGAEAKGAQDRAVVLAEKAAGQLAYHAGQDYVSPLKGMVRPVYHCFIEPFVHEMTPRSLIEALPPTDVMRPMHEVSALPLHHSLFAELLPNTKRLKASRTTFPAPPPELVDVQLSPTLRTLMGQTQVSLSHTRDRDKAYSDPANFRPDWSQGWTPGTVYVKRGAGVEAPQMPAYTSPAISGGVSQPPVDNPFFEK